jgi:ABC-type transport system involved in multi-copper enzyme maturation permease subunit
MSTALAPRPARAFAFLVAFAVRRQARVRQMVGIAVGLLLICLLLVGTFTASGGWDRYEWRLNRVRPYTIEHLGGALAHAAVDQSEYMDRFRQETRPLAVFSRWVVFLLFLGFLLPLFSLSFATGALGQEREGRSLVWLMTRPLPRSGVYLAKFLGMLPWCLALTVGGFGLLCLAGGETGRRAFVLYAPGVFAGSLAFAALFHLFGALLPRPSIVALLYAFFFETLLSELPVPGTLKRLSINYYTRCLLYSAGETEGVPVESSSLFVPVSPTTAWVVLLAVTVGLTVLGMWLFAKMEHRADV